MKEKTGTTRMAEGGAGMAKSPGLGAASLVAALIALFVLLRRKG